MREAKQLNRACISTWRFVGLVLVLAAPGCAKPPPLGEVSGTVTMEGKPLAGVNVTFSPIVEKGQPRLASSSGTTDAAGRYTLTCEDGRPGAMVGKHRVVVVRPRPGRGSPEAAQPPPGPGIPSIYTTASATPLEFEVAAGSNDIPLEVKRQ